MSDLPNIWAAVASATTIAAALGWAKTWTRYKFAMSMWKDAQQAGSRARDQLTDLIGRHNRTIDLDEEMERPVFEGKMLRGPEDAILTSAITGICVDDKRTSVVVLTRGGDHIVWTAPMQNLTTLRRSIMTREVMNELIDAWQLARTDQ